MVFGRKAMKLSQMRYIFCCSFLCLLKVKFTRKIDFQFQKCGICNRYFDEPTSFFIHILICHKGNLFAPKADRFTCTAHLAHPDLPTHKINITLKRPRFSL